MGLRAATNLGKKRGPYVLATLSFVLAAELIIRVRPFPPMMSPAEELKANAAMAWLADRNDGGQEGPHRIHAAETKGPFDGAEHITIPLGLEVIAGYVPSHHRDYMYCWIDHGTNRENFLFHTYRLPSKLWGLLNVRYVLSPDRPDVPGLRHATTVAPCDGSLCHPKAAIGPHIYENQDWLPRVYRVPHAIALVGSSEETYPMVLHLQLEPSFDPRLTVFLQSEDAAAVAHADLVLPIRAAGRPVDLDGLQEKVRQALTAWGNEAVQVQAPIPGSFRRLGLNGMRVSAPGRGWLVISETSALFDGWTAEVTASSSGAKGERLVPLRAHGVITALEAPQNAVVELHYTPPRFYLGLTAALVALIGFAALSINGPLSRLNSGGRNPEN
jgi:hypothetical protein